MVLNLKSFIANLKPMYRWSPEPPEYYTYAMKDDQGKRVVTGAGQPHVGDADLGLWNIKWLVMPDLSDLALRTENDPNLQDRACLVPSMASICIKDNTLAELACEMDMRSFVLLCFQNWHLFEGMYNIFPHVKTSHTPSAKVLYKRMKERAKL